jgi:hypothetical protein
MKVFESKILKILGFKGENVRGLYKENCTSGVNDLFSSPNTGVIKWGG